MKLPEVREVSLANGFGALLVRRATLPLVASVLWYRVGARDERTGETGLSHFLEHMMFKGTDRYRKGEIDLLTSKMGGSNNAFTDNDATAYYFALAADRWETALEIEASRMRGCLLDEAEFQSEKSVVLEELAMGEDDPWRPLYQAAETLLYQVHPYRHPVIGWKEDVERVPVAGMRAYYERHYGPNRAFLVVCGAIDLDRTEARVHELFGPLPRSAAEREAVLQEPQPKGERRAELRTPHSVTRLCLAVPTCRMAERDDFAIDVLAHDLGIGKGSRLYRRLVQDEELVTDVSVVHESRLDPGALFVLCELRDGAPPARVEAIVKEEMAALGREGVKAGDLRRILAQIRAAFLFESETALSQALKLARFHGQTPGGWRTLEQVLPTYDSLTAAELKDAARRYFADERQVVVWAVPAASPPRKAVPAKKAQKPPSHKTASTAKKATKKPAKGSKGGRK